MPGAEWRTDPYPMPGHPPNYGAKLFEEAATGLGLHPYPTPVAINNLGRDGRPGCSYCGFCSSHGCPIEAKNDMRVTALRKALATGRLEIRPDSYAYRVVLEGTGRPSGRVHRRGRARQVRGRPARSCSRARRSTRRAWCCSPSSRRTWSTSTSSAAT